MTQSGKQVTKLFAYKRQFDPLRHTGTHYSVAGAIVQPNSGLSNTVLRHHRESTNVDTEGTKARQSLCDAETLSALLGLDHRREILVAVAFGNRFFEDGER
jgi:hypothetical protein